MPTQIEQMTAALEARERSARAREPMRARMEARTVRHGRHRLIGIAISDPGGGAGWRQPGSWLRTMNLRKFTGTMGQPKRKAGRPASGKARELATFRFPRVFLSDLASASERADVSRTEIIERPVARYLPVLARSWGASTAAEPDATYRPRRRAAR